MVSFDQWISESLKEGTLQGRVKYNPDEDSYVLEQSSMDIGLYPIWETFDGKKIRIKIEVLDD